MEFVRSLSVGISAALETLEWDRVINRQIKGGTKNSPIIWHLLTNMSIRVSTGITQQGTKVYDRYCRLPISWPAANTHLNERIAYRSATLSISANCNLNGSGNQSLLPTRWLPQTGSFASEFWGRTTSTGPGSVSLLERSCTFQMRTTNSCVSNRFEDGESKATRQDLLSPDRTDGFNRTSSRSNTSSRSRPRISPASSAPASTAGAFCFP